MNMTVTVAKMMDGRVVEIVKTADTVAFSDVKNWIMVCFDFEKVNRRREQFKWVPADTKFEWVREFGF